MQVRTCTKCDSKEGELKIRRSGLPGHFLEKLKTKVIFPDESRSANTCSYCLDHKQYGMLRIRYKRKLNLPVCRLPFIGHLLCNQVLAKKSLDDDTKQTLKDLLSVRISQDGTTEYWNLLKLVKAIDSRYTEFTFAEALPCYIELSEEQLKAIKALYEVSVISSHFPDLKQSIDHLFELSVVFELSVGESC